LCLCHQYLKRQAGNRIAALLLQEQVADLGAIPMGDDDAVVTRKPRDLPGRYLEVYKLFLNGTRLSLVDERISA